MNGNKSIISIVLALCAALLMGASTLAADPKENPLERARHHMELGQEAFADGRFEEAAAEFANAYSASAFSAFLYNAGLSYEKAGNAEKAVEMYRQYLAAEPEAKDYAQVDMKIRALQVGAEPEEQPQVQISQVEMKSLISVRTNPGDATVRILNLRGEEVSTSRGPSAQTVERGKYIVEASHPNFRTVQTELSVNPGQVYIVVVEMSQGAFLGFLHVTTDVPGADVYIDDKSEGKVGITPWGNVLPAGKHKIIIEKPGYQTLEQEFDMQLGEEAELALTLERLPFGSVLVKTNVENATVYLDAKPLGTAPIEENVEPGKHTLLVSAEDMKDYTAEVEVKKGQRTKVLVRMNPTPSRASAWVSLGFSVAFFTGGGITGGMALKTKNELESLRNQGRLADNDPRIMKGFLLALGADIAFGVGTIVGGLSIYYFLRDPLPPSEGKLFDPVDFEGNPDSPEAKEEIQNEELPPATETSQRPRLMVVPLIDAKAAGLGVAVTF